MNQDILLFFDKHPEAYIVVTFGLSYQKESPRIDVFFPKGKSNRVGT